MREITPESSSSVPQERRPLSLEELTKELRLQRSLLEENRELLNTIHRTLRLSTAFSVFRTLIWLVPLILGLIYLPPLLREVVQSWQSVFESTDGGSVDFPKGLDIKSLQELLQRSTLLER
jgi:hypothetical protein